jgi:xylulokinase
MPFDCPGEHGRNVSGQAGGNEQAIPALHSEDSAATIQHYMGVDIGTSGCKAAVFDQDGKPITFSYREYDVISPHPGWAELDSDEVMRKCFEVIKEAASHVPGDSIGGLGISSQGEAFTPIDNQGRALGHALVSSDARAEEYVNTWPRKFGEQRLYEITGHTPHTLFSLFKLLWLKEHHPDIWSKTWKFLCFEDLLQYRLGLNPAMGWPLAGRTMLFDVIHHHWSSDILAAIGIQKEQLAAPLPSGTVAGTVKSQIAQALGLNEKVFVVTGGHDQPCSALGAGATDPGVAIYATGTVECITAAFAKPIFAESLYRHNFCTYDHVVPNTYATVAYSLTGGNILKWFRDQFGAAETAQARNEGKNPYEILLRRIPDAPTNLLVLPYFTPTGTPYFDANAAGAILGLKLSTTREEILKSLLEGVAFEMRLNLELLERSGYSVHELRATGGGAKSELWNQLKADVMGKKITAVEVSEVGCMGAAMLARAARGGQPVNEVARHWVKLGQEKLSRPEFAKLYTERFEQYKKLYPALRQFWAKDRG